MKILLVVLLGVLGTLVLANKALDQTTGLSQLQFEAWTQLWNKAYDTEDEKQFRYNVWVQNADIIADLKLKNKNARFGHTKFGDLTPQEFKKLYLGKVNTSPIAKKSYISVPQLATPIPKEFDWRSKNAVTAVRDQGECGSCWAFSAVETVESQWYLAGNNLTELSVQQVVDCDKGNDDEGCNGGDTPNAYQYIINSGGLEPETQYPYKAEDNKCTFKKTEVLAKISTWKSIAEDKNETEMQMALLQYGPLSICVDAQTWQFYFGGIISFFCGTDLDHCVQITGFSVQSMLGYEFDVWNIRNSWGADWGEYGFIWVERGYNLCGVAEEVTIPIV